MEDESTEHSAFADNELARQQNMRLQKARRDLEKFLSQLPPSANDHELNELLADMNRDGAFDFRCDEEQGLIVGVWSFALNPNAYAHRISLIERTVPALIANLFLHGEVEFFPQAAPPRAIR
jgi:hypothetical protein